MVLGDFLFTTHSMFFSNLNWTHVNNPRSPFHKTAITIQQQFLSNIIRSSSRYLERNPMWKDADTATASTGVKTDTLKTYISYRYGGGAHSVRSMTQLVPKVRATSREKSWFRTHVKMILCKVLNDDAESNWIGKNYSNNNAPWEVRPGITN